MERRKVHLKNEANLNPNSEKPTLCTVDIFLFDNYLSFARRAPNAKAATRGVVMYYGIQLCKNNFKRSQNHEDDNIPL